MERLFFLLFLVIATAARGQPDYGDAFKELESELSRLHQSIKHLKPATKTDQQELRLLALEINFQALSGKIARLEDSLKAINSTTRMPDNLKDVQMQTASELLIRRVSNFRSFVLAWYDLGEQLEAISATAESILLFPETKVKSRALVHFGQYSGLGGSIAGAFLANKHPGEGISTIGVSLSVTGLLGLLFKNKQPRIYIENVSRNIAFTDNVHAFERIASTFSKKASILYHSARTDWNAPAWQPGNQHLREFYALIVLRKDLNVIVRHMKAKAEHLMSLPLTQEGRQHLNNLIFRYNKALQSWEISEIVYLNTYEYLSKITKESFVR